MMMNVLKILMSIFLFFEHSVDNMEDDNEDDWEPSPYYLQMNGAIEVANKNIKKII